MYFVERQWQLAMSFSFLDPPGDPGKKSSIHFRLCTSFCPSAKRRLDVGLAPYPF